MIALANGFSHPDSFARFAPAEWGGTPHTSTLAKARASVKNSRAGCCASANGGFLRRKVLRINFRPARAHTHASRGRGNELGRTIGCTARNTAGRFGRRVHPTAKFPDKIVVWILRPLRSSHPPRNKAAQGRGTQRAGSTTPTLFTPLQAIYTRPSAVATIWRTVPPPEGIAARANCSVLGLNWMIVFGFTPDSLYQTSPSGVMAIP